MGEALQAKIELLVNDEEYIKHLLSLGSAEAISYELADKEIDVTPEQIRTIGQLIRKKQMASLLMRILKVFQVVVWPLCF